MLLFLGYTFIDVVDDGEKAVQAVKATPYSIVLMDCMVSALPPPHSVVFFFCLRFPIFFCSHFFSCQMPEMDGIQATRVIRQEVPSHQQPIIIALTADAFYSNTQNCIRYALLLLLSLLFLSNFCCMCCLVLV